MATRTLIGRQRNQIFNQTTGARQIMKLDSLGDLSATKTVTGPLQMARMRKNTTPPLPRVRKLGVQIIITIIGKAQKRGKIVTLTIRSMKPQTGSTQTGQHQ
uniref:Uncharacterized protein n=1 Tax=Cacopsylla melanoneura TaxID=428564 RepID=A0A8D8W9P3_9HEMI